MADVFISYSQQDRDIAKALADFLASCGYDLWWDYELVGGTKFRNEIKSKLESSKAAIVIWTPNSVESDWVVEEAEDAKYSKKLVATRIADLDFRSIPLGFRGVHTELVTQPERILQALEALGVGPSRAPSNPGQARVVIDKRLDAEAIAKAEQFAHWEFIRDNKDPTAFSGFIDLFPNSSFAALARIQFGRLASEAWEKLCNSEDMDALHGFVKSFPLDPRAANAQSKIQVLEVQIEEAKSWARIKDTSDIAQFETHLSLFPDGFNNCAARARLQALDREREIDVRWQAIANSVNSADFEEFLSAYPDSSLVEKARARLEEVRRLREEEDWHAVRDAFVPVQLLGFLKDHPSGAYTQEAIAMLTALPMKIENDAWRLVRETDTPILIRGFLAAFPSGMNANEAQARLKGLTAAESTSPQQSRTAPPTGPDTPIEVVTPRAESANQSADTASDIESPSVLAGRLLSTEYVRDAIALIEALGGTVGTVASGKKSFLFFSSEELVVTVFDQSRQFDNEYEMTQWTIKEIIPKVAPQT